MRDRRYWQAGHPERQEYVNRVTEGWQALADVEQGGDRREVHVRAYSRVRDGRTEQVAAYVQTRPAAQANATLPVQTGPAATGPAPRPGITATSDTLITFIGGAGGAKSGIVRNYTALLAPDRRIGHRDVEYYTWDERERVLARIAATPLETRTVLVGHSWGGDTAAQVAAALGQRGRPVDTLVTVDPVGRWLSEEFFRRVGAGSIEWVNIRAHGATTTDPSDTIAMIGGSYADQPRGHASTHLEAPFTHNDFRGLLEFRGRSGRSGLDRLFGR
jgi:pimeloyl-ACP methyl ester carboxylesterase